LARMIYGLLQPPSLTDYHLSVTMPTIAYSNQPQD